ncbi:hypothetical protein QNI19_16485 [Cytophagaceae bacterium DM2B3-1]|uniref:Uncharacterized protein n=1 Tax=Xanthocytophaga flava TaxID=3048013 RepID=A0ABT7CPF1_9BACT|nr:hypothetical protein [Xanthocytophaga flavus]MDJ1494544.1 hypothetical protein [Xanthocytophaga flavus]
MKQWAKGITSIRVVEKLPRNSPAAVNKRTGEMLVMRSYWESLNDDQKKFIREHENAHLTAQTKNELLADEIAFNEYVKGGNSLKNAVNVLADTLQPDSNPEHYKRLYNQTVRALAFDKKISLTEAEKLLKQKATTMNTGIMNNTLLANGRLYRQYQPNRVYNASHNFEQEHEMFLGGLGRALGNIGKSVAGVATFGLTNKVIKTADDKDREKAAKETAVQQTAAAELAQQTALVQQQQKDALAAQALTAKEAEVKAAADKEKKKLYWIMGGGGAALLIVIIVLFVTKK